MAHEIDTRYGDQFHKKTKSLKRRALECPTYMLILLTPICLDKQAIPRLFPGLPPNEDDYIRKKQRFDERTPFEAETFQ